MAARIGFVGLGKMGAPMARRLLGGGFIVSGFDSRPDAIRALVDAGGAACSSLASLARQCEIVITMLPNGDVVREVVLGTGADSLREGLAAGSVLIDMSSSSPTGTRSEEHT